MSNNISFSFVIPVYNGMPYIKECIESIQNQDYKNFNIIILENSSNDGTAEYLKTLNARNIEIIPSDTFLSIEENWARIKDTKRNEFMIVTGADDKYHADYLSEILKLIRKYPQASIYRTNIEIINEKSQTIGYSDIFYPAMSIYDYLYGRLLHTYFATFAGYCYRSRDYDAIGGIDCVHRLMHPDDVVVMKLAKKSFLAISPKNSAYYRSHKGSESGTPNIKAAIDGFNYFIDWLLSLRDEKLTQILKDYLPTHLEKIKSFLSYAQMQEHKKRYVELNINEKDLRYMFIKIREKIKRKINKIKRKKRK